MVRTQIYLPEATYKKIKQWAKGENTTLAELIRRAVERMLQTSGFPHEEQPSALKKIMEIKGEGGQDSSIIIDQVIYGSKANIY